jgi:hypothetical protein
MINYKLKKLELKLNLLNITNDIVAQSSVVNNNEDDLLLKIKSPLLSSSGLTKQQQIFNYLVTPSCLSPLSGGGGGCFFPIKSPSFCSSIKKLKGLFLISFPTKSNLF